MARLRPWFALVMASLTITGCSSESEYPDRPITLVCPWGAGGGTDRVSRKMAQFLEEDLGVPVNVINATGGQGVTGHARGLLARPDGYTISMMTLELNMLHWRGLTKLTWEDSEPLMSLNEDPAAIFVRADADSLSTIKDLEATVKASPGKLRASGTAALGAWHLALAGWLISIDQDPNDITWIPSQGARPSLLELISGGVDLVCCSVPEAESLLSSGDIRCLGVMADHRLVSERFSMHPTLKEQGSDWTLTGWRGLGVAKGTPEAIQQRLVNSLRKIVTGKIEVAGETFPEFMDSQGFDRTWRAESDFDKFLDSNNKALGRILTSAAFRNVKPGPVGPMLFPLVAFSCFAASLIGIGIRSAKQRQQLMRSSDHSDGEDNSEAEAITQMASRKVANTAQAEEPLDWKQFVFVVAAVLSYLFVAEVLGFVVTSAVLLVLLSVPLGATWKQALLLGVLAAPLIYSLFAHFLEVPLPLGLMGR